MLINEVCTKCRLTKKAIEYYTEQGLVQPKTLDNGYRDFSDADIEGLKKLAEKQDWEYINAQLEVLEKSQTILQRMINVFPGYYGKYISLHFARYLNEPVVSDEALDEAFVEKVFANMNDAISDTEKYIAENKEILERYMQLKQSDEFKTSPGYRLQEHLRTFNSESGYDTVFIPAMRKLSQSYRKYHDKLEKANEVFLSKYPNEAR